MKIKDIVFCDDIRHEMNNKTSLMGIYGDRIIYKFNKVETWPVQSRLALMIRIAREVKESNINKFKFTYQINGKPLPSVGGTVNIQQSQTIFSVNIIAEGLPLEKGMISFDLELLFNDSVVFNHREESAIVVVSEIVTNGALIS